MKKLILSASVLLLSLGFVNAQTPGITATSVYDDFQQVANYSNPDGSGIYWYSGAATAPNGTRVVGSSTFSYATSGSQVWLAADFGNSGAVTLDLSSMADIEVDLKNANATKDLVMRVYLKDVNNKILEIEPNVSDTEGVPDFGTATSGITWDAGNLVYPTPTGYPGDPAVYPTKAYNGFVLEANTQKTYRIDLSSVASAVGGLWTDGSWGTPAKPDNAPTTSTPATAGFDITQVKAVEFTFNENTAFNLSDNAIDKGSYKFDAKGPAQNDWSGDIIFYSFKVGSVLSALPADPNPPTGVNEAAINNSLKVYPNPVNESEGLTVSYETSAGTDVSLTDIIGNKVYSSSVGAGENKLNVPTAGLQSGMYILNIATENGVVARKITIK